MIKIIFTFFATMLFVTQVFAIDKKQINLNQTIWGTWGLFNPSTACTENYMFSQPGTFVYKAQKKELKGDFAVVRNNDAKIFDLLILEIQSDNGEIGCGGDNNNYQGQKSNFFLKWLSPTSAELCLDNTGKQCTGLYLNKR